MIEDMDSKIEQEYDYLNLKKEHGDLLDAHRELEIKLEARDAVIEQGRKREDALAEENRILTSKNEEFKEDLKKSREDVGRKNGMIDDLERENKRLKENYDLIKGVNTKLQEDLGSLKDEKRNLLTKNNALTEELIVLQEARRKDRSKASTIGKEPKKKVKVSFK